MYELHLRNRLRNCFSLAILIQDGKKEHNTDRESCPVVNNTSDAIARLHLLKCIVDARQRLPVRDELVHLELAVEVVVDQAGQLRAALDAAKGAALPYSASDELEC